MEETTLQEIRLIFIGDLKVGKKKTIQQILKLNPNTEYKDEYYANSSLMEVLQLGKKRDEVLEEINKCKERENKERMKALNKVESLELMKKYKIMQLATYKFIFSFFPIVEAQDLVKPTRKHKAQVKQEFERLLRERKAEVEKENGLTKTERERIMVEIEKECDAQVCEDDDNYYESKLDLNTKEMEDEMQKILEKKSRNDACQGLENVFLFCFSLNDYTSFLRIKKYYDCLTKRFHLQECPCCLLGTKLDIAGKFKEYQINKINKFAEENKMKYYKYSNLIAPSFIKFFESFFNDHISSKLDASSNMVEKRLHQILTESSNFAKAPKNVFKPIQTPGPGEYKNNVYDYPRTTEELNEIFSHTAGVSFKKMFIDKTGFYYSQPDDKKNKKNAEAAENKKSKTVMNFFKEAYALNDAKKDANEALQGNKKGYSLGIKKGNYNFKSQRKQAFQKKAEELFPAFDEDDLTLHIKRPPTFKDPEQYMRNKQKLLEGNKFERKTKDEENKKKIEENRQKKEEEREAKMKSIVEKRKELDKKLDEIQKVNEEQRQRAKTKEKVRSKVPDTSCPAMYDIREDLEKTKGQKGFRFACHEYQKNRAHSCKPKQETYPAFPNLKSDFDKFADTKISFRRTAERFNYIKTYDQFNPKSKKEKENEEKLLQLRIQQEKEDKERIQLQILNKRKGITENKLKRDEYAQKVQANKIQNEKNQLMKIDQLLRRMNSKKRGRNKNYEEGYEEDEEEDRFANIPNINYDLVEDMAPKVSLVNIITYIVLNERKI